MSKGTTPTQIRIPLDLKAAARAKAAEEDTTLSEVVVALLRDWVASGGEGDGGDEQTGRDREPAPRRDG